MSWNKVIKDMIDANLRVYAELFPSRDDDRINDLPDLHLTGKHLNIIDETPYKFESYRTVDGKLEFYEMPF